jgi:hypothetical protein
MKTLIQIENAVCEAFGVTPEFIHEKSKADNRALYRYIIGYVFFEINGKTFNFTETAYFCGINRCTLIHGIKVVNNELDTNPKFKAQIIEVFKRLGEKTQLYNDREEIKREITTLLYVSSLTFEEITEIYDLVKKL